MSIEILNKFNPPAPIYTRKPPPDFKNDVERQKYWEKKKRLWLEGNGDLTGMHIYYLDEVLLYNRVTGESMYPICRDVDVLIFHEIERLRKQGKWLYITKGRGIGLSTIMFNLPHYFNRMYAGTNCVLTTGKDKATLSKLFDYTMFSYDNMNEDIRPSLKNKNQTAKESFLNVNIKTKGNDGKLVIRESKIICKETSDTPKSPTAFSGYGAIYGGLDEIPLHPRRRELIGSAKEIFRNPITKKIEGFCLGGGTCEDSVSGEDLAEMKKFIETCEAYNFEHLFLPAYWGRCMTNGWTDIEKATEEILQEREKLEKAGDELALKNEIKNNPLTLDEIFDMAGSARIEEDVVQKIRLTIKNINEENPPVERATLVNMGHGGVTKMPDNKSNIYILENPKPSVRYIVGVDGTGTTKEGGVEKGSNIGVVVSKMFDPNLIESSYTPIAYYTERPKSFEDAYNKTANIIRYYNMYGNCQVMYESNQANEHFGAYLIKEGLAKSIMYRKDLSGASKANEKKMGTFRTIEVIDWQYRQLNIVMRRYGQNFKMKYLLEQMLLPEDENADVLDAWLMCLVGMGVDFDAPPKPKRERMPTKVARWNTSKEIYEWVEV